MKKLQFKVMPDMVQVFLVAFSGVNEENCIPRKYMVYIFYEVNSRFRTNCEIVEEPNFSSTLTNESLTWNI